VIHFFGVNVFVSVKKTDICQVCARKGRRTCIESTFIGEFQILSFCMKEATVGC